MYNHLEKKNNYLYLTVFSSPNRFFIRYNFKIKNTMVVVKNFEEFFDNSLRLTS